MITTATATAKAKASHMTGIESMPAAKAIDQDLRGSAHTPARPAAGRNSASARAHLNFLRARLMIFLYRHPLDNNTQIMDVIDNTESSLEIKLLLDYVLAQRMSLLGLPWTDRAAA